ncbi:MAG: hypothetical protein AB7U20_06510 [Planctomycetaceae bacterium]
MTLAEALEQVDLEPGKTYRCRVRGMEVKLQVRLGAVDLFRPDPIEFTESDMVPIAAWCDLPGPKVIGRVIPKPGADFTPVFLDLTDDQLTPE